MNIADFKATLAKHTEKEVGFALPDGDAIPDQCHVTEVGLVTKRFVDCGGTIRQTSTCMLQIWEGNDPAHRLTAVKLARILEIAECVVTPDSLNMEVEYEACSISQYPIEQAEIARGRIVFHLGRKHTDCLAREICGLPSDENETSCCASIKSAPETSSCCSADKGC